MSKKQSVAKQSSIPSDLLAALAAAIRGRGPEDVVAILPVDGVVSDTAALVAATALCAIDRDGPEPASAWISRCLDCIVALRSSLAESVLFKLASSARMAGLRVEAIRRLGRVASTTESLDFLATCTLGGDQRVTNYQGDNINAAALRLAAIEALGFVSSPRSQDFDCLVELASSEAQRGEKLEVFEACTSSLRRIARPENLTRLVDLAAKCHRPEAMRRALAACADIPQRHLKQKASDIGELLVRAVHGEERDSDIVDALEKLASAIPSLSTVRVLGEQHSRLSLDSGLGRIAARLMESYCPVDETLTSAYLSFAHSESNVRPGCACILGLARCAAHPGNAVRILTSLVHRDVPGYRTAIESGVLGEVVCSPTDLVAGLCEALDGIQSDAERARFAALCCDGLLRVAIAGMSDAPDARHVRVGTLREVRRQKSEQEPRLEGILRAIRQSEVFGALSSRLVAPPDSPGSLSLAGHAVQECDEVSQALLTRVLSSCGKLSMGPDGFTAAHLPLVAFESMFWTSHQAWLRKNTQHLLIVDGHLNRYLLDAVRRHDLDFVGACQMSLSRVQAPADADFVLESMALCSGRDITARMADYAAFAASTPALGAHVRQRALELLSQKVPSCGDAKTVDEVLARVHGCFEDVPAVRLAAYNCCKSVASPSSIAVLRKRIESDGRREGKEAIREALKAIREKLLASPPPASDATRCVAWLRYIAGLGDEALLERIYGFLQPPHPEESVRIAALQAVELLRNPGGCALVREFIDTVSPSGAVLAAAQHAVASLEGRKDVELREILACLLPADSPVLDLDVNYECLLGLSRVRTIARGLKEATEMLRDRRWDHCVTALDGVCDVLCRVVFEKYPSLLGYDPKKGLALAQQDYGTRVRATALHNAFPTVQPQFVAIHDMRGLATTAHLEDADGTAKPGLTKHDAEHAVADFKQLFPRLISSLTVSTGGASKDCAQAEPSPDS